MLILTLKTDQPEAEVGLYEDNQQLSYEVWQAHRELSVAIHSKIKELLESANKDWENLEGVACFKGPGSFTGLRIGMSVANALATGLDVPVVAFAGLEWKQQGIEALLAGTNHQTIAPHYDSAPKTTKPVK